MVRAPDARLLSVRMTHLLDDIEVLETSGDPDEVDVRGVEHDSRRASEGVLFCCLPGARTDGHDHAAQAVERGASALLGVRRVPGLARSGVVQVRVAGGGARPAMARAAAAFWGYPARSLLMAGVTGTNGKTSVTHLIGAILEHAGHPTTVIGTLSGPHTTPEATDLQRMFAASRDAAAARFGGSQGAGSQGAVSMEVSSHALVQARVDAICFDVAVFTNLSHEHLDFHASMEEYFSAKASLFEPARARRAVVYAGDPWGVRLREETELPVVAVHDDEITDVRLSVGRSTFCWRGIRVTTALTGALNVRNAHLAAEAAVSLGLPPDVVAEGLLGAPAIPGRVEPVAVAGQGGSDIDVLVDYAHTPAALDAVLTEARTLAAPREGHVIVVFGAGGDRDATKRPAMGATASRLADVMVLTSDNPRSEDPDAIIAAVRSGVPGAPHAEVLVEPQRGAAIEKAIRRAARGDVVVVAGKGHETTQTIGNRVLSFDDRRVAAGALEQRRAARGA